MRPFALAFLLVSTAGVALADPVPRVNIGLAQDGAEIAATTTLEDGGAVLEAPVDGEYGLVQQSTIPVESRLTALIRQEILSVDLPAGPPPRGAVLAFAARAGDSIALCLETLESARQIRDAEQFPTLCAASETTRDAGHSAPEITLPISDIDPTLPAPEAPELPAVPAVQD